MLCLYSNKMSYQPKNCTTSKVFDYKLSPAAQKGKMRDGTVKGRGIYI